MKRNVKNDKVLKAITIGLAAMIAATSVPVTVLAEDTNNENSKSDPTPCEKAESESSSTESSCETAENTYVDAVNTIVNETTPAPVAEGDGSTPVSQEPTVPELFAPLYNAAQGTTVDENGNIIPAVDENGNPIPALVDENGDVITTNYDNAEDNLTGKENSANAFLEEANKNDKAADEAATEATQSVQAAEQVAETVVSAISTAQPKADSLVDVINDETSDKATVDKAYSDLDTLVNETESTVSTQKEAYARLKESYNKAINVLVASENAYKSALSSASGAVDSAKNNLELARADVDRLKTALGQVELEGHEKELEVAKAEDIVLKARSANWADQRELLISVLKNYIAPQNATNVNVDYTKGFNGQNSSTAILTYEIEEGGEKKTITEYYNYDRANRKVHAEDQWKDLGGSKDIVIYKRTADEYAADQRNLEYYGNFSDQVKNSTEFKNKVNSGVYDVFKYSIDGVTQYLTRDEIENGIKTPSEGLNFTKDENGKYSLNGIELTKIDQSTKDTPDAKVLTITTKDKTTDPELKEFVSNEMVQKYAEYNGKITRAERDIDAAEQKADNLKKTINNLQNKKRVTIFATTLKDKTIGGLLKTYLGDYLTDAEIKKIKTVDQAIDVLNGLLEQTDAQIAEAELVLKDIKGKRDELKEKLYPDVVDEDDDDDDDTSGGGDTTGGTYDLGTGLLTIPGYEIPPITLPTTPSGVAGVRAAASRPTGVLGVKAPETKAEKTIANKTVVKPAAKKTVAQKGKKIADPETPLAATPFVDEDGMKIPWIWLLIIAALGAVGKKMYDEHKKKVQAEEEAKKYND